MLLYNYEKKGLLILLILTAAMVVIPRHIQQKRAEVFQLGNTFPLPDTTFVSLKKKPVPLELNSADSTALLRIRGIGPYYASKIIRYRERLGGYVHVGQLKELHMTYFDVDSCASLFRIDPTLVRKKDLNRMTFREVLRHPYLEYEDVQLIFRAKNKYGKITVDTLKNRNILPPYKLKKINPYFL